MENQRAAKRRREEEAEAGSIMEEDRISQLPEPILENVISFLPQDDAVRTCILSKTWRHLGPTRPKIEFHQIYGKSKENFFSVVENTLQRYDEKNLSVQEFILSMRGSNISNSNWLLNKWIVKLHMLNRLELDGVYIEEQTFENIMSRCPSIQHLVLNSCRGLSSVKVNKARNLKHLDCSGGLREIEIDDDAPSLETIRITHCRNWYLNKNNNNNYYFFPRLKSLCLWRVHLTTESFDNLSSNNCPCLEKLQLFCCSGFTEFQLSNRSIKRLIITNISDTTPIEAAYFDVPNILYFEFEFEFSGLHLPPISFKTTSREWKSHIKVCHSLNSLAQVSSSTWSLKLHEFLKALSQSQISLHIGYLRLKYQDTKNDGGSCEPVAVEHLCLMDFYSSSEVAALLNCVFRICCPRYVGLSLNSYSRKIHENQVAEFLRKTLVNKGETRQCHFWQQDLEESSIQVLDKNTKEWHDVPVCEFSNHEEIRFRFKWRDLN